ncbi:Rhodanese-like domain-containing protein [Syncephalis plumigaleata]|nr:Rhodanese-like domain-containing protein [Syncephalis plumigaleata]
MLLKRTRLFNYFYSYLSYRRLSPISSSSSSYSCGYCGTTKLIGNSSSRVYLPFPRAIHSSSPILHRMTMAIFSHCSGQNTVEYIDSDELASLLRNRELTPRVDYVIIDVRDDDFEGGNIVSAINVPSHRLLEQLPSLIKEYAHVPRIIFHCALSQVRGPTSAGIYHQTVLQMRNTKGAKDDSDATSSITQQVLVLRGGFALWQAKFKDTTDLIENYNRDLWEAEYM